MFFIKKVRMFLAVVIIASAILSYSASAESYSQASSDMNEVYEILQTYHVSGVNETELSSSAINGMIEVLKDPYTQYFSEEEWQMYQGAINQNYVGIGIRMGEDQNGFYAAEVFAGSPAAAEGILQGDYIVAVEGKPIKDIDMNGLIDSIIGPEGTKVTITIKRLNETKQIEMLRAKIQIPVVTSKWFAEGIGYIRVSGFSDNAKKPFIEAVEAIKKKGAKGLIVDFRGNPGGYLHTATSIAKEFIESGTLIHTKDRYNIDNPIEITDGNSVSFSVVLLVDGNSASASEVVAGALQDYKLATLVGTKTFGKGSVQSLIPLSSGGFLKVTIEEYLTPKLRQVNHVGIMPDIEVHGSAAQMITALHTLGLHNLQITADKRSMRINQIPVTDSFDYIQENGKVYVHSRILAALIDGDISWNEMDKAVEISSGKTTGTFLVSSKDVKYRAGATFIELAHFKKIFAGFNWSTEGEQIVISVKQGNSLK